MTHVTVHNTQRTLSISSASVKKTVQALLKFLCIATDEIIIHFVTQKKICALHETFFNDPTSTDCISFPIDAELLGEIFICPQTAKEYALRHNKDSYEELTLYLVHGILHLIGYDDTTSKERMRMRKKERECLTFLTNQHLFVKK